MLRVSELSSPSHSLARHDWDLNRGSLIPPHIRSDRISLKLAKEINNISTHYQTQFNSTNNILQIDK